ncbi:13204_t:CDS:1, partial [Cetraspora pellucida]
TFNLAQKVVQFAVEAGGESLCYLKRSLNDWFAEEQRLNYIGNNNKENFDSDYLKNPVERQQKGQPLVKRFKSSTKQIKSKKLTMQN